MADTAGTPKTQHRQLAEEYLRLGGRRQSKFDDNLITMRNWKGDPPEAEEFWQKMVEPLSEEDRKEVIFFLPDITDS